MGRVILAVGVLGLLAALVGLALGLARLGDPAGWDTDGWR
jgi:hypothetical protein